jgi:hypothetical protein
MDWTQVLTVFAVIATNLGTIIALYIQLDKKLDVQRAETTTRLDASRTETNAILLGIQQEIKDFHGKMERLDAEFKSHLMHQHK